MLSSRKKWQAPEVRRRSNPSRHRSSTSLHPTLIQQDLLTRHNPRSNILSLKVDRLSPLDPIQRWASSTMSRSSRATAFKRLMHEYRTLSNDSPEGIVAGPKDEDNYFLWTAMFQGPEGTPFEGGVFEAELRFPDDYPLKPPEMKFVDKIWHPNGKISSIEQKRNQLMNYSLS
jgi:hypothetical protein